MFKGRRKDRAPPLTRGIGALEDTTITTENQTDGAGDSRDLAMEKLRLEIEQLRRPFWKKPGILIGMLSVLLAILGLFWEVYDSRQKLGGSRRDAAGLLDSLDAKTLRVEEMQKELESVLEEVKNQQLSQAAENAVESQLEREAKQNIEWAVKVDSHRDTKYHRYKQSMSKFEALLRAQDHNPHSQATIKLYGRERTEAYLRELGE